MPRSGICGERLSCSSAVNSHRRKAMNQTAALLMSLVSMVGACVTRTGRIDATGSFRHAKYPLRVGYQAASDRSLLGPDWRIENYVFGEGGFPERQKTGADYFEARRFDLNTDGKDDVTERVATPDLRLEHLRTGARIFLKAVPLSLIGKGRELSTRAQDLVDGLSGSTGVLLAGDTPRTFLTHEKRSSSLITASARCKLGAWEALMVEFETADVDQLRLDSSSRSSRGRLVLIRTGFVHRVTPVGGYPVKFPVLLVVGLISRPAFHTQHVSDYLRLLGSVGMGGAGDATPPNGPSGFQCEDLVPWKPGAPAAPAPSVPTPKV